MQTTRPSTPRTAATARRPRRRRVALVLAAALTGAAAGLPVAGASAAVTPKTADLNAGAFTGFDQINETTGSLSVDRSRSYGDSVSAHAVYSGGGANGFARGIFNVGWATGDDVDYGGAFFLPAGFASRIQSETDLMRHDNYGAASTTDYGGVGLLRADRKAHLFRVGGYVSGNTGSGTEDMNVTGGFSLPEGRWFWLEVHQKLSPKDGAAVNEVWIDDTRVASSTKANDFGRGVTRLRYGIVAIGEGAQTTPLELWFARAMVRSSHIGPLGGTGAAPTVPPVPAGTNGTAPNASTGGGASSGGGSSSSGGGSSSGSGGSDTGTGATPAADATHPVRVRAARIRRGRLSFRVAARQRVARTEYRLPRQHRFHRYAATGVRLTRAQRRSGSVQVRVTLGDHTRQTVRLVVRRGHVRSA